MRIWMIFSTEPSPNQRPMVFLDREAAMKVHCRINTEMAYERPTLFEIDTEDGFQGFILSGGRNWFVSYDTYRHEFSTELCLVEERPLTEYEGEWSMTVRAESADEAVKTLSNELKKRKVI